MQAALGKGDRLGIALAAKTTMIDSGSTRSPGDLGAREEVFGNAAGRLLSSCEARPQQSAARLWRAMALVRHELAVGP
jgi:hypothetical protein